MPVFSDSTIENIKNRVNIADVISQVVELKRTGTGYKGLCPFHNEKTPSFSVSEEHQFFNCFGCGTKGDVFTFVEKYYNMDFSEAVEKLAKEYGIPIEYRAGGGEKYKDIYEANRLAAGFFYRSFTEKANRGYGYMMQRGLSPRILKRFGVGYADGDWHSLMDYLESCDISEKTMFEAGLISRSKGRYFDKFRDRVMFPIINTSGKVIGFGGRGIGKDAVPKYLNTPETPVFRKKNNLYGLNLAKMSINKEGGIIVVEGYMDVIALSESGIENAVATLGTALTDNQASLIRRYTKDAVLSYDADNAGRTAALRGSRILKKEEINVKVLHVTDGKDPDEYIRKNGPDAFRELVKKAPVYEEYRINNAKLSYNTQTEEGKVAYLREIIKILNEFDPLEREIYIKKVAEDEGISETALRLEVSGSRVLPDVPETFRRREVDGVKTISQPERELIRLCLRNDMTTEKITDKQAEEIFRSPGAKEIFYAIKDEHIAAGDFDIRTVIAGLDDENRLLCEDILKNVPVGGEENEIFEDCMYRLELFFLEETERELIKLLAESEGINAKAVDADAAMRELLEIQNKIRKKKGRR